MEVGVSAALSINELVVFESHMVDIDATDIEGRNLKTI